MINTIPPGDQSRTHIIGRSQGYAGLAVHFTTVVDPVAEAETPCLRTAWLPTPDQLAKLNAGASVVIELINVTRHPPIMVNVGDAPEVV